jgi:predicted DsbA family dithiol-disulfide isomerase
MQEPTMTTSPLAIDVFSDVVCPWCFIGKRRLEKAIALRPDIPVDVHYRPYFLNPWVPRNGMSRTEYLTTKFGSPGRYEQIAQRVVKAAESEGLTYKVGALTRQPNTLDCHRLILWAGRIGKAAQIKQRLMEIYFTEGGDLTNPEVLVQAASDCGLDPDEVRRLLAGDTDVALVEQAAKSAQEAGIEGVPFYVFGGVLAVSGAQAPDYLAGAIERAANQVAASPALSPSP